MTKEQLEQRAKDEMKRKENAAKENTDKNTKRKTFEPEPDFDNDMVNSMSPVERSIQSMLVQNHEYKKHAENAHNMTAMAMELVSLAETLINEQRNLIESYRELLNMKFN